MAPQAARLFGGDGCPSWTSTRTFSRRQASRLPEPASRGSDPSWARRCRCSRVNHRWTASRLRVRRAFQAYGRRVERMDALGVDLQFLSVMPPLFRYGLEFRTCAETRRAINDELGETAQRWPTRFALATLPMADSDAAIAESSTASPRALHSSESRSGRTCWVETLTTHVSSPLLAAASARGLFVLVHPSEPRSADAMTRFYLGNLVGNPFETTVAAGSLVFGGVLSRLPNLLICLAHGGGYAAFGLARFPCLARA